MTLLTTPIFDFHRVILKRSYGSAYDFDSDSLGVRGKEILEGERRERKEVFSLFASPLGDPRGIN